MNGKLQEAITYLVIALTTPLLGFVAISENEPYIAIALGLISIGFSVAARSVVKEMEKENDS
jgi:uncharacterized membrane protein YtjA (UPF0391 family)